MYEYNSVMSFSQKLHIHFLLTGMCIPAIWRQGNLFFYSGISVTQEYNLSHYTKLCILSHICMHTEARVYLYHVFSSHGAFQSFNSSAVLEVIFFFSFDRPHSYSYSALIRESTHILSCQHETLAIERCSIPGQHITLVNCAFNNPSHCIRIRAKLIPC